MYCGDCDVDQFDDGLDEYRGLGLVPAIIAAPLVAKGTSAVTGLVSSGVSAIGNLFGGPDDKPSGWQQEALSGRVRCGSGGKMIYDYAPGGYHKGDHYGPVSVDELEAALAQAPQGRPGGDAAGTVEGLIYALGPATGGTFPRPRNNRELANAAVYIAHGKGDCEIRNEQWVGEHVDAILRRYRASSATLPSPEVDLADTGGIVGTVPELGDVARRYPVATIGALAALAFGASMLFKR